jgi:hypothetical protein
MSHHDKPVMAGGCSWPRPLFMGAAHADMSWLPVSRTSAIGFEHDVRGHLTGASRLGT